MEVLEEVEDTVEEAVLAASEEAVLAVEAQAEAGKLQLDSLREWQLVPYYTAAADGATYR